MECRSGKLEEYAPLPPNQLDMPAKRRSKIKVFVSSRSIAGFTKSSLQGTNYIRRQATILALLSLAHDVAHFTFPAETPHGPR
jgi:hypothetical protein